MAKLTLYAELLVTRYSRIMRSELPGHLRRRILRSYLALLARRALRRERDVSEVPLLNYRVATYSLQDLQYFFEEIFIFLHYLFTPARPQPFILDCGSNIGVSILFFKTLFPEANIIGFEPAEPVYALLQRNVTSNRLTAVQVHQMAVGGEDGRVNFYLDPDNPGSPKTSMIEDRMPKRRTSVQQVRLSKFIDRDVDFLKLDVEGAEDAVLGDLVESGTIDAIDQLVVEYHHHINKDRDAFSEFLSQLERCGFGYQIGAACPPAVRRARGSSFQDIHLYAYRKRPKSDK